MQFLTPLIQCIDTRAPCGDASLQFRQVQFGAFGPFAQHVELLAAFDDPVADIFATVEPQPIGTEPDPVARNDAAARPEFGAMFSAAASDGAAYTPPSSEPSGTVVLTNVASDGRA